VSPPKREQPGRTFISAAKSAVRLSATATGKMMWYRTVFKQLQAIIKQHRSCNGLQDDVVVKLYVDADILLIRFLKSRGSTSVLDRLLQFVQLCNDNNVKPVLCRTTSSSWRKQKEKDMRAYLQSLRDKQQSPKSMPSKEDLYSLHHLLSTESQLPGFDLIYGRDGIEGEKLALALMATRGKSERLGVILSSDSDVIPLIGSCEALSSTEVIHEFSIKSDEKQSDLLG